MKRVAEQSSGYTLIELVTGLFVFGIIALSFLYLFTSLVSSTVVTKRKAQALALATNQMEYLKSLPYNNLAVAGGNIVTSNPLPASKTQTVNGVKYTIATNIEYVDDAFDGCGNYPSQQLKQTYCKNLPVPSGITTGPCPGGGTAEDCNPADYKLAHVTVTDPRGVTEADIDTQIAARVAETASTTGALFVSVLDGNGNPLAGAAVHVTNTTSSPNVDVSDVSDSNGIVIFYGLPVDTNGYDYTIAGSKSGYSSLTTIAPTGSLQPNYSSQQIFTQLSSFVTLPLKPQGTNSLLVETTDTSGNALSSVKVYIKGGYKKYTVSTDTSYYYDNLSPDSRPTTDTNGLVGIDNLAPGGYYFCGDTGATSCTKNGTTYYLAAVLPYTGSSSFSPVQIPTYEAATPPTTTFAYNSTNYLQKARLILTTSSTYPRLTSVSPYELSLASTNLSSVNFTITGANLPCDASPGSCATQVSFSRVVFLVLLVVSAIQMGFSWFAR